MGLVSLIEPTTIDEALLDNDWILAMQEELNQFTRNDVWDLVPKPKGFNVIGTKWVFRNKLNGGIQRRSGIDLLVLFDGRPLATHRNPPVDPLGLRQLPGKFRHLVCR